MKAAVYYETGAPSVFRYEELPDPEGGPDELLVKVEVVSVEGGDTLNRLGGEMTSVPHVVGYLSVGTILRVGADVEGFEVGERVVSIGAFGSHAAVRVVSPAFSWQIPDNLATDVAACVPITFGTAHDSLSEFAG